MRYPTDRGVFHSIFGTSLNGMGLFRKWHNQTFWEHPAFNSIDGFTPFNKTEPESGSGSKPLKVVKS